MDFWHDNWMGSGAICNKVEIFYDYSVFDFQAQERWDVSMLRQFLDSALVEQTLTTASLAY